MQYHSFIEIFVFLCRKPIKLGISSAQQQQLCPICVSRCANFMAFENIQISHERNIGNQQKNYHTTFTPVLA